MLPLALKRILESGEGILFLGAGIGYEAKNERGELMPDAGKLAAKLATTLGVDAGASPDLSKLAELTEIRKGRAELVAFLSGELADFEPQQSLRWLIGLPWKAIYTTNYDRVIMRAFELNPKPRRTPAVISAVADLKDFDLRLELPIVHLHGALFDTDKPDVLITESDYAQFRSRRRMLFELLKRELATSQLFYVGYSHRDPNWKSLLAEMKEEFAPSKPPTAFRLAKSTDLLDKEILTHQGIVTIDGTLDEFATAASAELGTLAAEDARLAKMEASIPSELVPAFRRFPAPMLRLLTSWTYVNQAPFHEPANIADFLRGHPPNWSLVGQQEQFRRDVEDQVLDELLDFATAPSPGRPRLALLAPAGYGVTTTLMSLAAAVVKEKAGPVFMLKRGAAVQEGDVEFAASIFDARSYFVIDNAVDHAGRVTAAITQLHTSKRAACFLLGDRQNEWRSSNRRPKATEFGIEPLSESEILRVLEFLERHHALNKLLPLTQEERAAVLRQKHDRQLLVALREATEKRDFDSIIEDEYRSLPDDFARSVYAAVSGSYSMRKYLRDGVLAHVAGMPLEDLYKRLGPSLDGVVLFELLDPSRGVYGARCRHHVIADIVWSRCVGRGERETILLRMLDGLNLAYQSDRALFDAMIRSEHQIDAIATLDGRTQFFENACRKDPRNAYTRQHYARMLLRAGKPELARAQITQALEMTPQNRILIHTKGVVLRDLALGADSKEIGRRWLVQSEEAFRAAIAKRRDDPYAYQSLAELYFEWAKAIPDESEQAAYIGKAEEVISQGLGSSSDRDGLWIISSRISEWLGNSTKAESLLKRASATVVGRYLLGKLYLETDRPKEAIKVLQPTIESDPEEYRSFVVYALALLANGDPLPRAIAVLRMAENRGRDDARFIATLGGMCFLNADFTAAESLFEHGRRSSLSVDEKRRIHFRPLGASGDPMKGRVTHVGPGVSKVAAPGYPPVYCPIARLRGRLLRVGEEVSFRLAFNALGPIAQEAERIVPAPPAAGTAP